MVSINEIVYDMLESDWDNAIANGQTEFAIELYITSSENTDEVVHSSLEHKYKKEAAMNTSDPIMSHKGTPDRIGPVPPPAPEHQQRSTREQGNTRTRLQGTCYQEEG